VKIKLTKRIIVKISIILIIGVIIGLTSYFLPNYLKIRAEEERIVSNICKDFFSDPVKELNPENEYIEPWYGWNQFFLSPLNKLSFLTQQYDTCNLFLGKKDLKESFSLIDEESRENSIKLFNTLFAINKIFKTNCDSSQNKDSINILKEIRSNEFEQVNKEKLCHFIKEGGTDQEIEDFCDSNKACILSIKADPNLIKNNIILKEIVQYVQALRSNNKNLCPNSIIKRYHYQESFPRIPCQVYFIKDNNQFCDKIYNEIKKEICN